MARSAEAMKQFPYFLAVAEEQSFHRAALRLNIAQSALSRRIADLERELGGTLLFERQARGARLTDSGKVLLDDVRRILGDIDEAMRRVLRSAQGSLGSLNIGFAEGMVRRALLPRALRRFREDFPAVSLNFAAMTSDMQREKLRGGEINVAFVYQEDADPSEFALSPVGADHMAAVVPAGHRLTKRAKVSLADLAEEPLIFPSRRHSPRLFDRMITSFHNAGLSPHIAAEVAAVDVAYGLVAAGIGAGLVVAAENARTPDDVVLRPISDLPRAIQLSMIWRKDDDSPALGNFVRTVEAARDDPSG